MVTRGALDKLRSAIRNIDDALGELELLAKQLRSANESELADKLGDVMRAIEGNADMLEDWLP